MNLADLREALRVKTGYPERGESGTRRLDNILNQALRKLWGEVPEVLLREEYRIILEPEIQLTCTLVHTTFGSPFVDNRCFEVTSSPDPIETGFVTDKILRGRWFEVYGNDGRWHQRRIQDVFYTDNTDSHIIVVDRPMGAAFAEADMPARIYTYEYPYDASLQKIRQVIKNPETSPREIPASIFGPEMTRARLGDGWQDSGEPDLYQRGDFFQLPAPRYLPLVELALRNDSGAKKWGVNLSTNNFDYTYGRAGTFSYKICHVWGRWPKERSHLWRVGEQQGLPFYISSPSPATEKIESQWGNDAIVVHTPDVDYINGYGQDIGLWSYHRHGVEKWIFRARHDVETDSPADVVHSQVEADDEYYLWKIVDGFETSTIDNGALDPVDRKYPLKEFVGHQSLRFNRRPSSKDNVLLSCVRRPETLKHDSDASRIPPECYSALIELACSYLLGDRDGNLQRKSLYYEAYLLELDKLKNLYSFSGHERPGFGDGISITPRAAPSAYPIKEI